MVTEEQWKKAVEDESYRQEFLDMIDLEDAARYVSSLRVATLIFDGLPHGS